MFLIILSVALFLPVSILYHAPTSTAQTASISVSTNTALAYDCGDGSCSSGNCINSNDESVNGSLCTPDCGAENECNGEGTCISDDTCECAGGWSGSDCTTAPTTGGGGTGQVGDSCTGPSGCATGYCVDSVCTNYAENSEHIGDECTQNGECETDACGSNGTCICQTANDCVSDTYYGNGYTCDTSSGTCGQSTICTGNGDNCHTSCSCPTDEPNCNTDGTCTTEGTVVGSVLLGGTCNAPADCANTNGSCTGGVCVNENGNVGGTGDTCEEAADCQSNNCNTTDAKCVAASGSNSCTYEGTTSTYDENGYCMVEGNTCYDSSGVKGEYAYNSSSQLYCEVGTSGNSCTYDGTTSTYDENGYCMVEGNTCYNSSGVKGEYAYNSSSQLYCYVVSGTATKPAKNPAMQSAKPNGQNIPNGSSSNGNPANCQSGVANNGKCIGIDSGNCNVNGNGSECPSGYCASNGACACTVPTECTSGGCNSNNVCAPGAGAITPIGTGTPTGGTPTGGTPTGGTPTGTAYKGPKLQDVLENIKSVAIDIAGSLVIIGWIIAGILYLTAAGAPDKIKIAKEAMIACVIGTILVVLAMASTTIVGMIGQALGV